jgi:cholesterol transport system auxiliary component
MMKSNAVLMLSASLALSACVSLGGGKPPTQLLTLTSSASLAADAGQSAKGAAAITIAIPTVPQANATTRVAVSDGPVAIAYVKDAVWVEPPARLFQRVVSETVAAKTGRVVLDPRVFTVEPGLIVQGQLKAFGIDARRQEAVVIYDAMIQRDRGKSVETRRFEVRKPVASVTATPVGIALNAATNEIAERVADWIGKMSQ